MLKIEINKNNECNIETEGTCDELLQSIRILDTARQRIIDGIKEKTLKDMVKRMPNIPTPIHEKLIDKCITKFLEGITVVSRDMEGNKDE